MSNVIDLLNDHKSERSFTDEAIDDATLERIISTAYRAPTSVNSQQVSIVVIRDEARRAEISKIAGGQPWIAQAPVFLVFVLDMYKSHVGLELIGDKQIAHESVESVVAGATDVGIALGSVMAAARSEGLGIVPIGGIRRDSDAMIKLLKLPKYTYPVAGVVIGHVDVPSHHKPRLPFETFRHDETYQTDGLEEKISKYNQEIVEHWKDTGRTDGDTWSASVSGYYKHIYFPDVLPNLIKQGFGFNK